MKQKVFAPTVLVFIAALGIIAYTFLSSSFTFKDQLFYLLYPKTTSLAQEPLSISITKPLDGAILLGDTTAYITAVTSENIKISKVDIYINDSVSCTIISPPYVCVWKVPPGKGKRHTILAKAYDFFGKNASSVVTITVR